ncbi:MAG: 50S ribosomal protein L17 [Anaerolineae bacterium]|jgi:large subunit ribosomal protein L17
MRHRVSGRKLGRDTSHRNALRKNMIADLFCHEQILTTEGKARMLRPAAEKVITLAKRGLANAEEDPTRVVNARRLAAARVARIREYEDEDGYLEEVDVIKKLFEEIAPRYAERNGGYTRMIKVGKRPGDNADMAILMLVEEE